MCLQDILLNMVQQNQYKLPQVFVFFFHISDYMSVAQALTQISDI